MKEQLYTIPVNEALKENCECFVCAMYNRIENDAINFVMGPSYMEDDVRMETDKLGFCERHLQKMYDKGNRLGLALMMKTHADRVIAETEKLQKSGVSGLFRKNDTKLTDHLDKVNGSCYVCNRIDPVFKRYIDTFFYLYETEEEFEKSFENTKGLCIKHYSLLLKAGREALPKDRYLKFADTCNRRFLENMKRTNEDLSWFIDKFDYRNQDAPWKDSKDALQKMMLKQNGIYYNPDNNN